MSNIINNYWVSSWVEVLVTEEDSVRTFFVQNTDDGTTVEITENAARAMCMTPDSVITPENWEDFCTARGYFVEDN